MAVGEIFLAAFLQVLFEKLPEELFKFLRREGVGKKLQKWKTTFGALQAVFCDAEEKQLTSKAVKIWLDDLRDLAFDVEDLLDKFSTELLRRKIEKLHRASKVWCLIPTCCSRSSPSEFGLFMFNTGLEINEITDRLQDISDRKDKLGLNSNGVGSVMKWIRPPSSSLLDGPVVGRDEDKRKIIEFLLTVEQRNINFDVVSIVGMPGVGKTTLAGLVFNDDATKHFDIKVWVCVSDDFDYVRLTKAILKAIKSKSENFDEFSKIQDRLLEALTDKKFLIVLDDVWNTNYGLWATLQSPFRASAPGSKIIVTTRDVNVAKVMGAIQIYKLECILDDDCWKVFLQHAFLDRNIREPENLGSQKRKIVAKCNGLPLEARILGGLLRCKEMNEWEDILNDKLWFQSDQSNVLSLLLSYHYLPSCLKRCFAYCSILPKDYEFDRKQMSLLWMAEGLIQPPEGSKQMEGLGNEYFDELLARSFFQKSRHDESKFVMHDLMNDLAQWVAGEISFRLKGKTYGDDNQCRNFEKVRYSAYLSIEFEGIQRLGAYSNLKHLRTFLPLGRSYDERKYLTSNFTLHILPKLQCLRVLSLKGYNISKLPDSICELKLLRYLDLSYTDITSLPESVSSLYNLQTLLLDCCPHLMALPTGIKNLTNLRHLGNSNLQLEGLPPDVGKLTNIRTLPYFVVGKESGSAGVGELGPLMHLQGTLHISRLENVRGAEDAAKAKLTDKYGINVLRMEWSDRQVVCNEGEITDPTILEMLQPCSTLKELTILHYDGEIFPTWMGNPSFSNMVVMRLEDCNGCRLLPPLGQLALLKELIISRMSGVESVSSEFYGDGCLMPFPSLEILSFTDMKKWKDWLPLETNDDIKGYPCLKELSLSECPELEGKLPNALPSLAKLKVVSCKELVVSIPSNQMLCELDINVCKEVVCRDEADFESLRSVRILNVSKFMYPTEAFMRGLSKVEDLKVYNCNEIITFLQQNELQQPTSLRCLEIGASFQPLKQLRMPRKLKYLKIMNSYKLSKVPEGLHLSSLEELQISYCGHLTSFPESGLPSSLRDMQIEHCNSLLFLAKGQLPSSLTSLSIIQCDNLQLLVQEDYSSNGSFTPCDLESLNIRSCQSLTSISSGNGSLLARFKNLIISDCDALQCLSMSKLPDTLKHLRITACKRLLCLSSEGKLPEALEYIRIESCSMLTSLSSKGGIPRALKYLDIRSCGQLRYIAERFNINTCLGYINISFCSNLTSLPEGFHHLTNLSSLYVNQCENLVSFPEGRLPASNLRELSVTCHNLVAFPKGMNNLSSLQELTISYSQGFMRLLEQEGFPLNLTSLTICNLKVAKPLFQWGLHRLASLREFGMSGEATDMVSFPAEDHDGMIMMFPKSLIKLQICGFQNLERLSTGIQSFTSLQHLSISSCTNLKSLPKGGLPLSLLKLQIFDCPQLQEQCKRDTGPLWPLIAEIPYVGIFEL